MKEYAGDYRTSSGIIAIFNAADGMFAGAAGGDRTHDILSHSQAFCR
jgi:hypothetical protein